MGVQRLSQDFQPYTETTVLGKFSVGASSFKVTKLVIDGPSLIYHIFNAVLRGHDVTPTGLIGYQPSYSQINECLEQFLSDLTDSGVNIEKIIFDGGLPVSKRPVRRERVEKVRHGLETYWRVQTSHDKANNAHNARFGYGSSNDRPSKLPQTIWSSESIAPTRKHLLPPPPFMVASAIEHLKASKWSAVTDIVAGEADGYCALAAKELNSAILSNDSDLLLYDTGFEGLVVILRTIELVDPALEQHGTQLRAQCLRLAEIVKQLNVPNLLVFGYFRSLASYSSTSSIAKRSREEILTDSDPQWVEFKQTYTIPELVDSYCDGLDPRVAELICSLRQSETLETYLTPVVEDPTRDSAWSYGLILRQLAYSILLRCHIRDNKQQRYDHVTEYARKGPRMAEDGVQIFSRKRVLEHLEATIKRSQYYLNHVESNEEFQLSEIVLQYYMFAAEIVIAERVSKGRAYQPALSHLCPTNTKPAKFVLSFTWDDIHFLASMHCILYSLRILKSIISHVKQHYEIHSSSELQERLSQLSMLLSRMPSIADLFLDAPVLHDLFKQLPFGFVARSIERVLERVDPYSLSQAPLTRFGVTGSDEQGIKNKIGENKWQEQVNSGKKKSRKTAGVDTPTKRKGSALLNPFLASNITSTNTFDMLRTEELSSDTGE